MFKTLSDLSALNKPAEQSVVLEAKSQASDFDGIRSVVEDSLADLADKMEALMALAKATGAIKLDTVKDKDGMTVFKKLDKLTKDYKKAMESLMTEAEAMVMQVAESQVDEDEALLEEKTEYVLCLMKGEKCKGYYVADDQPHTRSLKKAHTYTSMAAAKKDAKVCNDQWDLEDGEKFVACKKEDCMKEAAEFESMASLLEGKNYADSSEFTEEFYGISNKILDIKRVVKSQRWMDWMRVTDHNYNTECVAHAKEVTSATDALYKAFDELEGQIDAADRG